MIYRCSIAVLLGLCLMAGWGCSSLNYSGHEKVTIPLNTGVKNTAFLSAGEIGIVEDLMKARSQNAQASLKPLRLSKGLSLAAQERAAEIADMGRKENAPPSRPLMERVLRYGKVKGSVAELVSHGYPQRVVVDQLMKEDNPRTGGQGEAYLLDSRYTVVGVGCTGSFYPICAITFATDFEEL